MKSKYYCIIHIVMVIVILSYDFVMGIIMQWLDIIAIGLNLGMFILRFSDYKNEKFHKLLSDRSKAM